MEAIARHLEGMSYSEPPFWKRIVVGHTELSINDGESMTWRYIDGSTWSLDLKEYREYRPWESCAWFPSPPAESDGIVCVGSRTTGDVMLNPTALVESLMNTDTWMKLFPDIICKATLVSSEDQQIEVSAEFQSLSVLVPVMPVKFLRRSFAVTEGVIVVDVPVESEQLQLPFLRSCLVRGSSTPGLSTVTWIDMTQLRMQEVHPSYHRFLEVAGGFGSSTWFWTLSRECRRHANYGLYLSSQAAASKAQGGDISYERVMMLAKEMANCLYLCISAATPRSPTPVQDDDVSFDMGVHHWSATKTLFLDIPPRDLLYFILKFGAIEPLGYPLVRTSHDGENYVSLIYRGRDKRFLREISSDSTRSMVMTALVDFHSSAWVISTIHGFIIHVYKGKSYLTFTYVDSSSSSCSQVQNKWKTDTCLKMKSFIEELRKKEKEVEDEVKARPLPMTFVRKFND